MKAYAGIDLHSSNNFIGIINETEKKAFVCKTQDISYLKPPERDHEKPWNKDVRKRDKKIE